ncbi:RPA3 domain-containing protein [Sporobolomyces salmoneus]|uniref:RPA3 domain-containing protein n=1 Tax=Sporobolomyces salmoneus TaxID=183962 RepID=UPI00317DF559
MDRPTPRMNAAKLADCQPGQVVRVVGKVITLTDDEAILETTDKGQITVRLDPQTAIQDTFVETIGKYEGDMKIHELISQNLGDSLDLDLANKVVELSHTLPEVFPSE